MYVKFETLFIWLQKLWSKEICIELVSEFLELLSTPTYAHEISSNAMYYCLGF